MIKNESKVQRLTFRESQRFDDNVVFHTVWFWCDYFKLFTEEFFLKVKARDIFASNLSVTGSYDDFIFHFNNKNVFIGFFMPCHPQCKCFLSCYWLLERCTEIHRLSSY